MATIWKLLCPLLVFLVINEGHGEPRFPYSAQGRGGMQRQGSFGRAPMNPSRFSSMESLNSGKREDSRDTDELELKILGNAIGEGMVQTHQSQKYKQSMGGLSPSMHRQQSPMFQKSGSGRSQMFQQPQARRSQTFHQPEARRSQMFQQPEPRRPQMFQQPQPRRSQSFQQPSAGRSQMFQKQMPARSFHQQPAAMLMASGFPKKAMPMASRGLPMRSPMRMPKPSYSMPSAARAVPMASRGFAMPRPAPMPMASPGMFGMAPAAPMAMSPFMAPPTAFGGGGGFAPTMMVAPPLPSMGSQNGPKVISLKDYLTSAVNENAKQSSSASAANSTKSSSPSGRSVFSVAKTNSSGTQQPESGTKLNVTPAPLVNSISTEKAVSSTDAPKATQPLSVIPVPLTGSSASTHEQDGIPPKRHSARRHKHYPHEHGGVRVP